MKRPFYVEPKFPLEVSAGDRVNLPVALMNATDKPLKAKASLELGEGLRILEGAGTEITVPANGSTRYVVPYTRWPICAGSYSRRRANAVSSSSASASEPASASRCVWIAPSKVARICES